MPHRSGLCTLLLVVVTLGLLGGRGTPAQAARPAIPILVESLRSRDPRIRTRALVDLRWWGPAAAPALPSLLTVLKDPTLGVRIEAVRVVAAIGPAAAPAVPVLRSLLEEERQGSGDWSDFGAADEIIGALGAIGEPARPALPLLLEALRSRQSSVRLTAILAVASLRPLPGDGPRAPATDVALRLQECLKDPTVRLPACWALWRLGAPSAAIIPTLRGALRGADEDDCLLALVILALMGPDAGPVMPELLACLKDNSPRIRLFAARALLRLAAATDPGAATSLGAATSALMPLLEPSPAAAGSFWDAELAAELIPGAGSVARAQIPRLVRALDAREPRVVFPACLALSGLETLDPGDESRLQAALVRLVSLTETGEVAIAIRTRSARLLARRPATAQATPVALRQCLRSDAPGIVRATAAAALLALTPSDSEAAAALRPLAADLGHLLFVPPPGAFDRYDPDEGRAHEFRLFWLDTLRCLGGHAAEALPFVRAARQLQGADIRSAALRTEAALVGSP